MPSTFSGRARPRVSKRRNISFLPSPASIRRVVHPDSSNVELPVLPDARMDTRNEIRFPPRHASTTANGCARHRTGMMAKCWAGVNTKSRKRNYTARYLLDIDALEGFRKSDGELILGQLKAVEVADDGGRHAPGLEELAGELLDVFHGDAFEQRDQILRGEVAFEVHVIARQAVHALAAAFEGKQRSAFQVVFRAPQFLGAERFIAQAAEFIEHGAHQLRSGVQRGASINRKCAGIAIGIKFAENRVGQALAFANILEQARRHSTAKNIVEDRDAEAAAIGHGQRRNAHADVNLLELVLGTQGNVRK